MRISNEAALAQVAGLVDEHFAGFGAIASNVRMLVIDVSGMTRMTSFGVRQWLKAMDALPKSLTELYLLNCPTFFVDQLNMVLNFGGAARVLTVVAPYTCPSCGVESGETIDVLAERAMLAKGGVPEKDCGRCGGKLEFDETPESYFSFASKYAASAIHPNVAQLLAEMNLYVAADVTGEKPPRIIKLVHGPVTYFRIIGMIGSMFRARPFLVGAEGEVVIDLAEIDRFDAVGTREWRRLLKNLSSQVPSVTLVDVNEAFLATAGDSIAISRSISVWSVLVPYYCVDCNRTSRESQTLKNSWPIQFPERVCATCGGTRRSALRAETLAPLQKAVTATPAASAKVIEQREEILSRALTDASVADAGAAASASLNPDDMILGKYKIVRRLSSGGMAEVFLANQVGIGGFEKPVALKRILRQLLESRHLAVDMFLNEAKIAGRLQHPNIVQVLDVGQVGGSLYLAMEYVHGKDLRELLKRLHADRATMPLGDACFIISQVALALHHAYWSTDLTGKQLAVVHRDVSPHNVILGYDGSVKLLDFGVAMSAVTEQGESLIAGKWGYMSPEHTTSKTPVDHRSDLFSVGVVMYLLCTGTMPFSGSDPRAIVKKIRAGQYKPLKEACPDIPDSIADLVGRLLAPNPEDRPKTGQEVATALTDFTRSYGIESSTARIVALLTQLFGGDSSDIRSSRPSQPMFDQDLTRRIAQGSSPTLPAEGGSPSPIPRSNPTTQPFPIDQSVSLARRSAVEIAATPVSERMSATSPSAAKLPELKSTGSPILKIVLLVLLLAAVFVALYFIVHPK